MAGDLRLIVNADDLGLLPRIDAGILRAHRDGIVTSATVLATGAHAAQAIAAARAQKLPLGVHLCLSTRLRPALPAAAVPSLAPGGTFRASWAQVARAWVERKLSLAEVRAELEAQLQLARKLGAEPDHLDAHQHLHLLPGVAAEVEALAARAGLPLRWPSERPRRAWLRSPLPALKSAVLTGLSLLRPLPRARRVPAVGMFEAGTLDEDSLLDLIDALSPGVTELGCHPGLAGPPVPEDPRWIYGWQTELNALCSEKVRARILARAVRLISYADL